MVIIVAIVSGWSLVAAQAAQGNSSGASALHPYVEGDVTYDSNVNNAPANAKGDTYLDGIAGIRGGYTTYALDLSGLGFIGRRSYNDSSDRGDFTTFGDVLKGKYGTRDQMVIEVDHSFRRVDDFDRYGSEAAVGGISPDSALDASSSDLRDIHQIGVSLGRNLTDKTEFDLGYRFDSLNYDSASLYDLISHYVQAESAYRMTDKTAGTLTLKYGLQRNDTLDETADYTAARIGLKTRGSDKLTFKVGGGVQNYEYGADNNKKTSFNFDGTALWMATEKLMLQFGGRNGMQLSSLYADNGTEYSIFWAGAACRVSTAVTLSTAASYRKDDYLEPVLADGLLIDRQDKGTGARVRAEYQTPAAGMKLYAEALYEKVDSNVSSYDKTSVGAGAVLTY